MLMVVTNLVLKGSCKYHISTHRPIRKYFLLKKGPFVNYKFSKIWY